MQTLVSCLLASFYKVVWPDNLATAVWLWSPPHREVIWRFFHLCIPSPLHQVQHYRMFKNPGPGQSVRTFDPRKKSDSMTFAEWTFLQHFSIACPAFLLPSQWGWRHGGSLWHEVKESRKQTERSISFENRRETTTTVQPTTSGTACYIGDQAIKRYIWTLHRHPRTRVKMSKM